MYVSSLTPFNVTISKICSAVLAAFDKSFFMDDKVLSSFEFLVKSNNLYEELYMNFSDFLLRIQIC